MFGLMQKLNECGLCLEEDQVLITIYRSTYLFSCGFVEMLMLQTGIEILIPRQGSNPKHSEH